MAPLGRYVLMFGGFAAAVGLTLYPIFFYPMSHLGDYRLKVWSDPFGRK